MPDFLEEKKREISQRLKELKPLVDEYQRLESAQRALEGVGGETPSAPARRSPARRNGGGGGGRGGSRDGQRGRPRGTGSRAQETLEIVRTQPGVTIPELAERMGIKQNYLYRVLPGLEQDGRVRKEGRGWYPIEEQPAEGEAQAAE